jgi:hypothetical protein
VPCTQKNAVLDKLAALKRASTSDDPFITATQHNVSNIIRTALLPQDAVDNIYHSHRERLERSFVNLHNSGGLKQMTLDRSIPVDPLTVLHHADEEVFER